VRIASAAQPSTLKSYTPARHRDKTRAPACLSLSFPSPFTGSRPGCPTHMFSWPGPGPTHILAGGAGDIRMNQLHSTYPSNDDSTPFGRWVNREPLLSLCSVCIERTCFFSEVWLKPCAACSANSLTVTDPLSFTLPGSPSVSACHWHWYTQTETAPRALCSSPVFQSERNLLF
jgi:hypothetical protein